MNSENTATIPGALFQQARSLHRSGRLIEALEGFNQVIIKNPNHVGAYFNRGKVLKDLARFDEALTNFNRAISMRPEVPDGYFHRGNLLFKLERSGDALASYDRAIALKPDYPEAYLNRGNALKELKQLDDALASYDRAIALKPDYADAYLNRGNALKELKRLDDALASYDHVAALKPGYVAAHYNRGNVLQNLNRLDDALASYDRAIALKPKYAAAHYNRGVALQNLKRFDDAIASCDRAIALRPDYAEAQWGKSNIKLLIGDYEQGWELHEWRWKTKQYKIFNRNFRQPQWLDEEPISGKTLLIHSEAGLGDTIQLCRYAPMVEKLNARVILDVPSSLVTLMSTLKGNLSVVEEGKPLPDFDLYCPAMSLPLAFKTTLETIPAPIPYLYADKNKQALWKKRLGNKTKPRVGLVWSGMIDRNIDSSPAKNRSIPLHLLAPLLQLPFEFHALQKGIRPDDAAAFSEFKQIHDHQKDLNDFSDTAAIIKNLDLVISIDTSVAHLAGALGQKVWVLLPFSTDYRWTSDGTSTPWYPTATLFRQTSIGDWKSVIEEIRLKSLAMVNG